MSIEEMNHTGGHEIVKAIDINGWRDVARGTGLFGLEGLDDLDRGGNMVWLTTVDWDGCVSWCLIVWCYGSECTRVSAKPDHSARSIPKH